MLRFRAKPTVSDAFRLQLQVLVAVLGNYMLQLQVQVQVLVGLLIILKGMNS